MEFEDTDPSTEVFFDSLNEVGTLEIEYLPEDAYPDKFDDVDPDVLILNGNKGKNKQLDAATQSRKLDGALFILKYLIQNGFYEKYNNSEEQSKKITEYAIKFTEVRKNLLNNKSKTTYNDIVLTPEEKNLSLKIFSLLFYLFINILHKRKIHPAEYGYLLTSYYFELLRALHNYSPEKCNNFLPYYNWYTKGIISDYIQNTKVVKSPVTKHEDTHTSNLKNSNTPLAATYEDTTFYHHHNIYMSNFMSTDEFENFLINENLASIKYDIKPEDEILTKEIEDLLREAVYGYNSLLTDMQKIIIIYKFGLNNALPKTYEEVANILTMHNYSKMTPSHIDYHLKKALEKLKKYFRSKNINKITDLL